MPTRRANGRYYIQRRIPGVGKVYRSLGTDRKGTAARLEQMLLSYARQGSQDAVRAWIDGDLSLSQLDEAYQRERTHELLREIRRQDIAVEDACKAALRDKAPDVADSTHERYVTGLGHFENFVGSNASVRDSLTEDVIQAFKAHRLEAGRAEQTVNNDLIAVSILVTYALRKEWIEARPEIKRFEHKTRIRNLPADDLARYMASLRPAFRTQMQLLAGTGLRLGESEALRVFDLELDTSASQARIKDAKTKGGVRTVFLPGSVTAALRAHIEDHGLSADDRLFWIERRTVQAEHNRACKIAGIPDYTIHDHRHTAAVDLARSGMPLDRLQAQLGHKNIEMTMKYAAYHPDYTDVAEYFDRMDQRRGVGASRTDADKDAVSAAAELLNVDAEALSNALQALQGNNDPDNSRTSKVSVDAD